MLTKVLHKTFLLFTTVIHDWTTYLSSKNLPTTYNNENNINNNNNNSTSTDAERIKEKQRTELFNAVSSGEILPLAYFVGVEQNLKFLVARDELVPESYMYWTVANYLTQHDCTPSWVLCIHERIVKCVSASLNHDGKILE